MSEKTIYYRVEEFLALVEQFLEENGYHYCEATLHDEIEEGLSFYIHCALPTKSYGLEAFIKDYGDDPHEQQEKLLKEMFGSFAKFDYEKENKRVQIEFSKGR